MKWQSAFARLSQLKTKHFIWLGLGLYFVYSLPPLSCYYYLFSYDAMLEGKAWYEGAEEDYANGFAMGGSRSVPILLGRIEKESPWDSETCIFPLAFTKIGQSAHEEIEGRFQSSTDTKLKIYYVYLLMESFHDYRHADYLITAFPQYPYDAEKFEWQLYPTTQFKEDIITGKKVSQEFKKWAHRMAAKAVKPQ